MKRTYYICNVDDQNTLFKEEFVEKYHPVRVIGSRGRSTFSVLLTGYELLEVKLNVLLTNIQTKSKMKLTKGF